MLTINLGLLYITGGSELREKTTELLREEIEGDGEENGGDDGELDTPGLPAHSHAGVLSSLTTGLADTS